MKRFLTKGAAFVTAGMMVIQPVIVRAEVETPAVETEAVVEETTAAETEAVVEETTAAETETVVEETTAAETETVVEETTAAETETVVEETTAVETEAAVEETTAVETEAAVEETTTVKETETQVTMVVEEERIAASTINVVTEGAVSGTDCTYVLNNVFSSATSGSTVVFPAGTYKLAGWVKLTSKSDIKIVFEEGAKLYGNGSCGGFLLTGCSNITIQDAVIENVSQGVHVESNSSNIKISGGNIIPVSSGAGIALYSSSGITLDGVSTSAGKFGVYSEGASNVDILNCTIANEAQGGIWVHAGTSDVTVTSSNISGCNNAGIWFEDVAKGEVSDCTLTNNGNSANQSTYGLKLEGTCSNIVIDNNDIVSNKKDGINIDHGASATVTNNRVQKNGAIGICVGNGSNTTISTNTITQNQDHGIILINSFGKITNNVIDGTNAVGTPDRANNYGIIIFCRNAADKANVIEVSGNTVNGMIGNGIQVTGDKTNPSLEGAINVKVAQNTVTNVGDNGITVNYNSHNAVITNNTVDGAGVNGIDIQGGSKNCSITGNIVKNSGYMGINIGSSTTGGAAEIAGNQVTGSANAGIHVTNSASSATIKNNTVSNHKGNFSIALVNGAKCSLANNRVVLPTAYIGTANFNGIYKYAIYIDGNTTATNGAAKFNFAPNAVATGATTVTGTGTPGLKVTFTLNGSSKEATIDSKWNYSFATTAVKSTDTYIVKASDTYGNSIEYTNGEVESNVDEEKVAAFVERMYTVALGRPADAAGHKYWTEQLVWGLKDGAAVAKGFVLSPEMDRRNLSNEQFVLTMYQTFFNRTPADGDSGKAFWINLLENGVSRAYVFKGFCHSAEFQALCNNYGITRGTVTLTENRDKNADITMYVFRCYDRTLGRQPDTAGINFWTGVIINKERTPVDVAGNFVFSAEFKAKNLSNEEYIKVLYRMFFDREADTNGFNFWLTEMNSGRRDRYKVFSQFANSAEFKAVLAKFGL